jgi:hypothetical protein
MLKSIDNLPAGAIAVEAVGRVSADDYRNVLEPAIDRATRDGGRIRILIVFGDEFEGFDAGAAWEDSKVGFGNWKAWERIAVVTTHGVMRDAIRAFAWLTPGEVRVFEPADRAAAEAWIGE